MNDVSHIERLLANDGFSLDAYLAFYLKNRLYNTLQLNMFFPDDDLKFKCSSYEIPWTSDKTLFSEINGDKLIVSELYSSQEILKYLNDVAQFDTGYKNGLVQIGYVEQPINHRLMCSCEIKTLGEIYLESPDEGTLYKISQNICLLLSQGEIRIHKENIKRFNGDMRYAERNYLEDTWVMKLPSDLDKLSENKESNDEG